MESEVMKKFNTELATLNDGKNLSKTKIQDITKAAIKAKANYKNVVFNIERLMAKSKPEQRLSALYVIDSIIRASKHQLKEKDVFGPRFIKQFDRILDHMLKCGHKEKYKTIRTMNLWLSNRVFPETDIQPFREKCKKAGLAIEFDEVEKAVKGSKADMSIYDGIYKKKEKSPQKRARPPMDDGLLGAGPSSTLPHPDIPTYALSEEIMDGTISEREMMELVQKSGIDRGGLLAKNRDLLQKTLRVFIATLQPKILDAQMGNRKNNGNNIQNVLTKDFEYSDDEDEKERIKEEAEKTLSHDEVLELAQSLLNVPTVIAQIHDVLNADKIPPAATIPPTKDESIPTSLGGFPMGQAGNLLGLPQLPNLPGGQFPGGMTGLSTAQMLGVQNAQNLLLQQRAAALLQNVPVSGQHNLLLLGNQFLNPFGIPTGMNPLLQPPNPELAAAQQQMLLNGIDIPQNKAEPEVNNEETSRQKQKESRERRKMGLPSIKPGRTIIASRTLWLKKIPANATETELKHAVESCGEATRVKIIGNRACAFVTMDTRKAANEVIQKMREVTVAKKAVKVYWARSSVMDADVYTEFWEADRGVLEIPYEKLPENLTELCEGAVLDVESLPENKRSVYNEKGESVLATPVKAPNPVPPPVPQPPPGMGFPFPVGLGQLPPGFNAGKPAPPGMHPLLNMAVPPPPGMSSFPPAPPPPGVGPPGVGPPGAGPPPMGFDPNKPPPMFPPRFHPGGPPGAHPPPFGRGNGAMPPFGRGGGPPPPMPFRGRGGGPPHFDSPRRGGMMPRPEMHMQREPRNDRGRLLDQSEMWNRERERSNQGDRRRRDDNPRRRSRWEEDDRNGGGVSPRRRSPERRHRSPSNGREQWGEPEVKRSSVDDEIVSSTTLDEMKPKDVAKPAEEAAPKVENVHEDKTDDVPMDLE